MTKPFTFWRKQIVNVSSDNVFEFFSNPFNMRQITPPHLQLEILNSYPIMMHDGLHLDFTFKRSLFRMAWVLELTDWNPLNKTFTEQQIKGPFQTWTHKHTIKGLNKDITEIIDDINYTLPFGFIGKIFQPMLVESQIKKMFDYRFRRLSEWFSPLIYMPGDKRFTNDNPDKRPFKRKDLGKRKKKPYQKQKRS